MRLEPLSDCLKAPTYQRLSTSPLTSPGGKKEQSRARDDSLTTDSTHSLKLNGFTTCWYTDYGIVFFDFNVELEAKVEN